MEKDKTYKPEPADLSGIKLPKELDALKERMARNTHDRWAARRISEGWTYGPRRNDVLKTNPCLVAYDDLPESEKAYDRITSLETLRLILSLGYKIVPVEFNMGY